MIPDLSVLWVIVFLLLTTFLLNTLIFQPMLKVIEARLKAVSDARELAQSAADRATAANTEYSQTAQRGAVRRLSSDGREAAAALDQRAALLGETRGDGRTRTRRSDHARVKQQAAEARATFDREADSMAGAIVSRVLGRAS